MTKEENQQLHQLYMDFSKAFPLESLKDMTLEQYNNLNRSDSFCYWVEEKTKELGSVRGGSSYKFGIYQYISRPKGDMGDESFDDKYAWNSSLGKTADEVFERVKSTIIRLAGYGREGNLEAIEDNKDLWPVIKWKIAFLYSNESIIPYYSLERLRYIADVLGMKGTKNASIADIQRFLIDKRENTDIFEYAKMLDDIWKENEGKPDDSQAKVWMWGGDAETFKKDRLVCGSSASQQMRDYSHYKDYETMRADFQKARGNTDVAVPDAYWKFMKDVHVGDIVVVFLNKRVGNANHHTMLGWGVFTSELINDKESENPLQRLVEWKVILDEPITSGIVKNTLFFHKTTVAQAKEIKKLLGISKEIVDKDSPINYWLVGYSFGANNSQYDRFVKEGIWESRHNDDSASDQQLLTLAKTISRRDIVILKSTSTKGPKHDQPFMRIKGIGIVTSDVIVSKIEGATLCRCHVDYVNLNEKDFDGAVYGSYRKTIHKADSKIQDIIDYVKSILFKETIPQMKYKKYIDILQESYNLVLTGAPGTGKTFMAHAIAEEMGAITKFVQFHPSFDYTDFVEGLRPVEKGEDQIGFRREDGIFKEFCREAIKNIEDSQKSVENLTKELSWQEKLEQFVDDASENGTKFKTVNGSEFTISEMHNRTILVHNETNEKTTQIAVNAEEILDLLTKEIPLNNVRAIRNYYGRKYGTQPDSYAFAIIQEIRKMKMKTVVEATKVAKKPFVFIIDEINRGEASKIFGELFYALDPGYRGKKNKMVQTQYQNLVKESDVFAKGFYVPENVYILATMNDIDRSVESMDFAMRRRFTWMEVTPEDTQDMLDTLGETLAADAKETMKRLNKAISETEGLGAAYRIGPAYFLKLGNNGGDFDTLWNMNIEPLLREYLRGFRKTDEILSKFREAYYSEETKEETLLDIVELIDED